MKIHECDQLSAEWFKVRAGMPTASEFDTVQASGKGGGESKTRRTYMLKLAGERITGEPMEAYSNPYLERGKAMEDEARSYYAFSTNAELKRVGFIHDEKHGAGCSPDALIGDNGGLEIKTAAPHILIDHIERDQIPTGHIAQCQGFLWIAQREYIDLSIYWPKMPPFIKRVTRDEGYIARLAGEVRRFNDELAAIVEKIKRYNT